jgi:molybdopterin converting factor small subunit
MNGSGLPDESSFNYDQARLNSPLNQLVLEYISTLPDSFSQPEQVAGLQKVIDNYISENPDTLKDQLHPVILKAIDDYVDANPGVKDGDLIKIILSR